MLDPAPAAPLPPALLHQLSWFTPNETEARFYAGASFPSAPGLADQQLSVTDARTICKGLQALGPRNVLLKLGGAGACALAEQGEWFFEAAPRVDVVDTTGAGDTLNAAFATALLRGDPVPAALRFAVAAASLSVSRHGAMSASPTFAEVASFQDQQSQQQR